MRSAHGVVGTYAGPWSGPTVALWARQLRARVDVSSIDLGVLFASPCFAPHATELLETLRIEARIPLLVGSTTTAWLHGGTEDEARQGFVLALHHLPGARLRAFHLGEDSDMDPEDPEEWYRSTGIQRHHPRGALAFASPSQQSTEAWLGGWNVAYPGVPLVGGLGTSSGGEPKYCSFLDGDVFDSGAVILSVGGSMSVVPVIAQGCSPIGESWTITKADRNFILGIANRPAYSVLVDAYNQLTSEERQLCQNRIVVGFASDEYRDDLKPGDFLVRQLLGADPRVGALAVGAMPRAGQTIQFQRLNPAAASKDLVRALEQVRGSIGGRRVYGGVAWTCQGRGPRFFGQENHDAGLVQEHLGPLLLSGTTANGELGPIAGKNHLHAYSMTLGLLVGA